jgi:hypothetical protein
VKVLAIALLVLSSAAQAATPVPCDRTSNLVANLRANFHEHPLTWRKSGAGIVLQLWGGPARSWTIVLHRNDGMSCVLAAGKDLPDWAGDLPGVAL